MRATVQRDTPAATDGFGLPGSSSWGAHIASLACWVWTPDEREVIDGNKITHLGDHRAIVPLGTDITEDDRITQILDRNGGTIIGNTLSVKSVVRRPGHLALTLEEVR